MILPKKLKSNASFGLAVVGSNHYKALAIYIFPRFSLWCYAVLSVLLSLGSQSLLAYGPNAKRRLSHGSVFTFPIPSAEMDPSVGLSAEDTHGAEGHKSRCQSLSGAQPARRPSLQSQRGHSSHPATPNCTRSSKGGSADEHLGVGLGLAGGSSRVHSQDPVFSEGAVLPPVMEDLGKADLVRENIIF